MEENILKKANQKRMLGDMAIEGGNFTTAYFKQVAKLARPRRAPGRPHLGPPPGDPGPQEPPRDPTLRPHLKSFVVGRGTPVPGSCPRWR